MLAIDELVEMSRDEQGASLQPGFKAVRGFIRDPHFPLAARAFDTLRGLMPDGTLLKGLASHLEAAEDDVFGAIAMLESYGAVEIEGEAVRVAPKFFWEKAA